MILTNDCMLCYLDGESANQDTSIMRLERTAVMHQEAEYKIRLLEDDKKWQNQKEE